MHADSYIHKRLRRARGAPGTLKTPSLRRARGDGGLQAAQLLHWKPHVLGLDAASSLASLLGRSIDVRVRWRGMVRLAKGGGGWRF